MAAKGSRDEESKIGSSGGGKGWRRRVKMTICFVVFVSKENIHFGDSCKQNFIM